MTILDIFSKCQKIALSKRHDYSSEHDHHDNFKRSAYLASWFISNEDKAYVVLIGTKLARLATLLNENKNPNNESIDDSFLDLVNYCALWAERRIKK